MTAEDKPRILVPTGAAYPVDAYLHALEASGAEPVVARPGEQLAMDNVDAVVLAGGPDVSPARFGAEVPADLAALVILDEERDRLEWQVLDQVERRGLPVLAICRGAQVLNVHRGGTLRLDLNAEGFTTINHRQRDRIHEPVHEVVVSESRLRSILGAERIPVNSSHHQAVRQAAPDLRIVAYAPDGVIEGVESADGRLIAVQWHPERLFDTQEAARRLFSDLIARVAAGAAAQATPT